MDGNFVAKTSVKKIEKLWWKKKRERGKKETERNFRNEKKERKRKKTDCGEKKEREREKLGRGRNGDRGKFCGKSKCEKEKKVAVEKK